MASLKKLQANREALAAEIKKLADRQKSWTAEDRKNWDDLNAVYDTNQAKLDAENAKTDTANKRRDEVAAVLERLGNSEKKKVTNKIGRDGARLQDGARNQNFFSRIEEQESNFATALQGWMLAGRGQHELNAKHIDAAKRLGINLASSELIIPMMGTDGVRKARNHLARFRNDLSSHDSDAGGVTISETFVGRLELAMLAYGGMFGVSEIIRTSTAEPMRWPTANDTGNTGEQVGENASVSEADPTFGQITWNAYKFSSKEVLVPFELLRDNAVNLAEVLPRMLGERLGRIQNTKYTTGTGASTPYGITIRAAAGVTAASATAITFDEVIDLEHAIDPSRRNMPGVGYMFHDSILKALRKLKDGNGQYLWQAGSNTGAPDLLNNRPYTVNQDMASSIAASAITMLFGELSCYKIRQVNAVRMYRLVERYRESDQDCFLAFMEGDGNLLDAGDNPVKKLTQAA